MPSSEFDAWTHAILAFDDARQSSDVTGAAAWVADLAHSPKMREMLSLHPRLLHLLKTLEIQMGREEENVSKSCVWALAVILANAEIREQYFHLKLSTETLPLTLQHLIQSANTDIQHWAATALGWLALNANWHRTLVSFSEIHDILERLVWLTVNGAGGGGGGGGGGGATLMFVGQSAMICLGNMISKGEAMAAVGKRNLAREFFLLPEIGALVSAAVSMLDSNDSRGQFASVFFLSQALQHELGMLAVIDHNNCEDMIARLTKLSLSEESDIVDKTLIAIKWICSSSLGLARVERSSCYNTIISQLLVLAASENDTIAECATSALNALGDPSSASIHASMNMSPLRDSIRDMSHDVTSVLSETGRFSEIATPAPYKTLRAELESVKQNNQTLRETISRLEVRLSETEQKEREETSRKLAERDEYWQQIIDGLKLDLEREKSKSREFEKKLNTYRAASSPVKQQTVTSPTTSLASFVREGQVSRNIFPSSSSSIEASNNNSNNGNGGNNIRSISPLVVTRSSSPPPPQQQQQQRQPQNRSTVVDSSGSSEVQVLFSMQQQQLQEQQQHQQQQHQQPLHLQNYAPPRPVDHPSPRLTIQQSNEPLNQQRSSQRSISEGTDSSRNLGAMVQSAFQAMSAAIASTAEQVLSSPGKESPRQQQQQQQQQQQVVNSERNEVNMQNARPIASPRTLLASQRYNNAANGDDNMSQYSYSSAAAEANNVAPKTNNNGQVSRRLWPLTVESLEANNNNNNEFNGSDYSSSYRSQPYPPQQQQQHQQRMFPTILSVASTGVGPSPYGFPIPAPSSRSASPPFQNYANNNNNPPAPAAAPPPATAVHTHVIYPYHNASNTNNNVNNNNFNTSSSNVNMNNFNPNINHNSNLPYPPPSSYNTQPFNDYYSQNHLDLIDNNNFNNNNNIYTTAMGNNNNMMMMNNNNNTNFPHVPAAVSGSGYNLNSLLTTRNNRASLSLSTSSLGGYGNNINNNNMNAMNLHNDFRTSTSSFAEQLQQHQQQQQQMNPSTSSSRNVDAVISASAMFRRHLLALAETKQ